MANGKAIYENPRTGQRREAPIGFSWTNLLFGFFVPLFRSDWKWAAVQFFAAILSCGICWLVFPFLYNGLYTKDLANNGYLQIETEVSSIKQNNFVAKKKLISNIHYIHSFIGATNLLQSPLLLAIRFYWGWQFMQDGWGKLTHLDKVTQFFASLNLPMPGATALMVASIELFGGFLFTFGIFSRLTSLLLFVNMTMAYLTVPDDRTNFLHIFSNPSDFYGASPYTYWFAALLILIFGPGLFAVDSVLGYFARKKPAPLNGDTNPTP